jgi:fatty-acyl-CoA synthase
METPLSPLEFARRTRRLHGAREAVVDGDLRFTYEQFFDRCDRWSAALQGLGVRQGDRVATIAPNTHAQLESFYAVPQLGAVLVPMNYRLTPDDFVYMVNHSGSTVLCVHSDYLDAIDGVRDQMPGVRHFVAFEGPGDGWLDYEALIAATGPTFSKPEISERDLLTINYTSGTTSRPKGVMITHRNAAMNTIGTLLHLPMGVGDRYLWTLPMFHANGWTFTWTVTAAGGTHVCLRRVDPALVFSLIRDEHVSWMCAAPTVLIGLANAPASAQGAVPAGVHVVTAGAPPAAATIERLEGGFGWDITHVYGLTETAPFITVCAPLPEHEGLSPADRAVLKARQGVELLTSGELRVVDDAGGEVPADGVTLGEITVRGNVVMDGYYNDPEATKKAMGDGWFHSGDAAVVHSDGYIEIRDRIKDVIISGGENISSVEVEGALLRHPAVGEAAVVGLPSEKWGETPHAFVVVMPGASVTADELIAFVRDRIAHYKAPRGITFVTDLPKTATGKIQKYVLRGGAANLSRQLSSGDDPVPDVRPHGPNRKNRDRIRPAHADEERVMSVTLLSSFWSAPPVPRCPRAGLIAVTAIASGPRAARAAEFPGHRLSSFGESPACLAWLWWM